MVETEGVAQRASRLILTATWDDAQHLTDLEKRDLWRSIPEFQRDARTKGVPYLGSGLIYPFPAENIRVADFVIPRHWAKGYGMDVGWKRTAAAFVAHDREDDVVYLYSTHSQGYVEPPTHAAAIKARGEWLPGRIDPASNASGQEDGRRLLNVYQGLGLRLDKAPNAVEAGILAVFIRLSTGRLKVFASCAAFWEEHPTYARDAKGKVVKENDHLLDALRYAILALEENANWLALPPSPRTDPSARSRLTAPGEAGLGWMEG